MYIVDFASTLLDMAHRLRRARTCACVCVCVRHEASGTARPTLKMLRKHWPLIRRKFRVTLLVKLQPFASRPTCIVTHVRGECHEPLPGASQQNQ